MSITRVILDVINRTCKLGTMWSMGSDFSTNMVDLMPSFYGNSITGVTYKPVPCLVRRTHSGLLCWIFYLW